MPDRARSGGVVTFYIFYRFHCQALHMLRDVGDKKFEPMRLLQMRMLFIFFVTTTNLETLDSSCNLGTTMC